MLLTPLGSTTLLDVHKHQLTAKALMNRFNGLVYFCTFVTSFKFLYVWFYIKLHLLHTYISFANKSLGTFFLEGKGLTEVLEWTKALILSENRIEFMLTIPYKINVLFILGTFTSFLTCRRTRRCVRSRSSTRSWPSPCTRTRATPPMPRSNSGRSRLKEILVWSLHMISTTEKVFWMYDKVVGEVGRYCEMPNDI